MGRWYEITRFPNSFQKKCLATKAEYGLRSDGKVTVKNTCKTTKGDNVANALARVVDKKTNAKLKVSFVPFFNRFGWFAGDYWILDLAADYSYVLVGSPDRNFLWVLSRTPTLDANIVEALKTTAQKEGFDVSRLVETPVWAE
jgi:apolipoprotein D and lipocalin family protein